MPRLIIRIIAVILFSLLLFGFIDFVGIAPQWFDHFAKIQFVPLLLSLSWIGLIGIVVLTLLFGRVYCSCICPLGIYQDIINRLRKWTNKKGQRRFRYARGLHWLRIGILVATAATALFGSPLLLTLLDPYSAFGRIAANVFKPLYMFGNNILVAVMPGTLYKVAVVPYSWSAFIVAIAMLLAISALAWLFGRWWCNRICPVGTLLGLLSHCSLFKVRIDKAKCNSCGVCAMRCKAECIDSKAQAIDQSRCITCLACTSGTCKQGALKYSFSLCCDDKAANSSKAANGECDTSRRSLLALIATGGATAALTTKPLQALAEVATDQVSDKRQKPITPPGSVSREHFQSRCTGCHLCVSKCPSNVLKPALTEYGIGGFLQPTMSFQNGFCNFDCTICGDVCPNHAILPLTQKEKHTAQPGYVVFSRQNCIVVRDNTSCGACSEHCPTQAISMVPYGEGGLTIPEVDVSICVGCGGCEYVCPAMPFRAVRIEGHDKHQKAREIIDTGEQEYKDDGFGF